MAPSHLDHADPGIGKMIDASPQGIWRRNEIGVQNENELAFRGLQTGFERAGLESGAVLAMKTLDVKPARLQERGLIGGDLAGLVRGVVQNLDLEPVPGIVEAAYGPEEPADDIVFIENRQLDGNRWQFLETLRGDDAPSPVLEKEIDDEISMNSKSRESEKDAQITKVPNQVLENRVQRPAHHKFSSFRLQCGAINPQESAPSSVKTAAAP